MTIRLYADEHRCAIYEEAPGGGDPIDPNSPMNRPVLDPVTWVDNIYFHSDLNYFGIAAKNMSAVVNHAAVPGATRSAGGTVVTFKGQAIRASNVILQHNLGYVPKFFLLYGGRLVPNGIPIQDEGQGKKRFVSAYATTTQILLWEVGYTDDTTLSAMQATYQVMAFRDPTALIGPQLDLYPGEAVFGRGKFIGSEPHLRADGLGDVQWPIARGRTAAVRNGGLRAYYPNGGYVDFREYNGGLGAPAFFMTSAGV